MQNWYFSEFLWGAHTGSVGFKGVTCPRAVRRSTTCLCNHLSCKLSQLRAREEKGLADPSPVHNGQTGSLWRLQQVTAITNYCNGCCCHFEAGFPHASLGGLGAHSLCTPRWSLTHRSVCLGLPTTGWDYRCEMPFSGRTARWGRQEVYEAFERSLDTYSPAQRPVTQADP